ncbi:hypothetical protein [Paenibacillus chitinolyticus]
MQMDFLVYQIIYAGDLTNNGDLIYQYLGNLAKMPGEHGFEYCITNEIDFRNNIISGCLSEEYPPDINSVDDEKNVYIPDVSPYLNTFFALDLQEKKMLIQHREYPAQNLDRHQTRVRLGSILNAAFNELLHVEYNYLNTNREITDEDFEEVFFENRVTLLRVKLFEDGRLLRDQSEIFEDPEVNARWIEGWNSDESHMHEIVLKAPGRGGDGDLRKSPLAITLLKIPNKEITELNYWTDVDGSTGMSRTDLRKFRIRGIHRHTQPITAIDVIATEIYNRRGELDRFMRIENME